MGNIKHEPRLYALDHLRAAMMLLGVVIHSAVSYMVYDADQVWPYRDPSESVVFDVLVGVIHSFRMPVFFLMAGFFAALIFQRRGRQAFISNRSKRILVPFLASWPILFPIIFAGFYFAIQQLGQDAHNKFMDTPLEWLITAWHLWFLYYLLMFYAVTLLVADRTPPIWWKRFSTNLIQFGAGRISGLLLLGFISAITFLPMDSGSLDSDLRWIPNIGVFLSYGFVYWCGWLLYDQRTLLTQITQRTYVYLLLSVVLLPISTYFVVAVVNAPETSRPLPHLWAVIFSALLMWSITFGITGFFLRVFNGFSPIMRYFTDSAYWVYLIHLPITIWTAGLLSHYEWSAGIKFGITFTVTLAISLITYHYCVRKTFIGYWLNGKRA